MFSVQHECVNGGIMSTNAYIGIKDGNDVEYVYIHFDGYPSGVGSILKEHYSNPDDVQRLISKGDMSSLGNTIDECDFYCDRPGEEWNDIKPKHIRIRGFMNITDGYKYLYGISGWEQV